MLRSLTALKPAAYREPGADDGGDNHDDDEDGGGGGEGVQSGTHQSPSRQTESSCLEG